MKEFEMDKIDNFENVVWRKVKVISLDFNINVIFVFDDWFR